jgi:Ca2+-binding EF-hand superfamily protein
LKDTFNAFDKDGSMELGYEEYLESWKFLSRPGIDEEIKKAFESIDVDGTGLVEWTEYVFSLMGEKALNFGALADLETLHNVLKESEGIMNELRGALVEAKESTKDRVERNSEMRNRLQNMKGQMNDQMVIYILFCFFLSFITQDYFEFEI